MSASVPSAVMDVVNGDAVSGVHYVLVGDGPRTVVLLHGFADNLSTWKRVIGPLAAGARVVAIDLPGFGRSTRPAPNPLLSGYADVVREVLDAEGIRTPVAVVGNSMGAAVATVLAAESPQRVERVVLIDMPGLRGVPKLWRAAFCRPAEFGLRAGFALAGERSTRWGQRSLGAAYRVIAAGDPRRLDPLVRADFALPFARRGSVPDLLPIGRALLADLEGGRLAGVLAGLTVPVLVVFGSRDILTPARVLRRIGRSEGDGGAVVIPACGHCPQLDQPGALLEQTVPFLRDGSVAAEDADESAIA